MPSPSSVSAALTASSSVMPQATIATSSPSTVTRLPPIRTSSSAGVRTGVLPRRVRRNEMPFCSAIAPISLLAWLASDGCSTVEEWIARIDAMSSSAICDGPSSPIDTPACEPTSSQVGAADRGHPDEVVRPREERRERRRERLPAVADLDPDRRGDQLLLRDEHLEVAVLVRVAEVLRVRRVRHLAVERDDRAVDRCRARPAPRRTPCAWRPPRRAPRSAARRPRSRTCSARRPRAWRPRPLRSR